MKAILVPTYGGSDVLEFHSHTDEPTLSKNQVMVGIRAASINPFDVALISGMYKEMMPLTFPLVPGGDFAGVVLQVDSNVTTLAAGEEIYGTANPVSGGKGSFAEKTVTDIGRVAKKPRTATFDQAAALPLVGSSAIQALEDHMKLMKGQKILIHGGAGGIGHIAIQLAKYLGATVATTVSSGDFDFAKSIGADTVIDYKSQQFETMLSDYDAVYDTVGGLVTAKSFLVLKKGGILVSMKGLPDQALAAQYGVTGIAQNTKVNTDHLERLTTLVDNGALTIHVDQIFSLEKIKEAWDLQVSGKQQGKIVLSIP